MITKPLSVEVLKQLFVETFLNNTDKVTKVSDHSVMQGVAYGISKLAQKVQTDIVITQAHLFPDGAYGQYLDSIAAINGIAPRFGALGSSTYLRLVATAGTVYTTSITFSGNHGIVFVLDSNVTVGALGYTYAKVHSLDSGSSTNVKPLSINTISNAPSGHSYVINEYKAQGGRDIEGDDEFRKRIKYGANLCANSTLQFLTQSMMKVNSNIAKLFYVGNDSQGRTKLAVATQNGSDLTNNQFDELKQSIAQYCNMSERLDWNGQSQTSLQLENVNWHYIDISFRCQFYDNVNIDQVRIDIQTRMSKYVDFTKWVQGNKVEWDDLLQIVKSTPGVKYVADQTFVPRIDVIVPHDKIPRFRSFAIFDLAGNVIIDLDGYINPVFYPSQPQYNYQQTILFSI